MFRKLAYTLAALGLAASIGSARAGTLEYSSYTILNGQNVRLTDWRLGIDETVNAGQFTFQKVGGGTLSTFCIDIQDWLQPSGQFSTGGFVTGTFGDTVNALLTNVTPSLASDSNASAALQVAIWKAEYGSALSVSGSRSVTDNVLDLAATYLGNVDSGLWTADPTMAVSKLNGNGRNQTQAYLSPIPQPAPMPEPATFAVLGAGLFGLVAVRRWRRPGASLTG